MHWILCGLAPFLLGCSLLCLLAWLVLRRWRHAEIPQEASGPFGILWMTPACQAALGSCRAPGRLQRMSPDAIVRRLKWADWREDEWPPTRARTDTWPRQAELISAGAWPELAAYQAQLIEELGEGPIEEPPPWPRRDRWNRAADGAALLAVLLLALALLAAYLAHRFAWCHSPEMGCEVVDVQPTPAPTELPLLSTDTLFDYNRPNPMSSVHEDRVKDALGGLLSQFGGVEVVRIAAHTDPIGATIDNRKLAVARAATVKRLFTEMAASEKYKAYFKSGPVAPEIAADEGAAAEDYEIWRECSQRFQFSRPKAERPLVDLNPHLNDGRVLCSQADTNVGRDGRYPACARRDHPMSAVQAENFRELTACLGPMRHVLIGIRHERQVVTSSTTCRVVNKKDAKQ